MNYAEKDAEIKRVTMLSELRNGLQTAVEAIDQYLGYVGSLEHPYDVTKISWVQAEGPSGTYEKATKQESTHYTALIKDLSEHNGKLSQDGFFMWLFSDNETIGRKPSKKKAWKNERP